MKEEKEEGKLEDSRGDPALSLSKGPALSLPRSLLLLSGRGASAPSRPRSLGTGNRSLWR